MFLPLRKLRLLFKLLTKIIRYFSHCADVATVHPDARQPVYRDAPGHISYKINCVLTLPTLPRYSPGSRERRRRLIPGSPRSTYCAARWSHGLCRYTPVLPRLFTVMSRLLPVAPRLHAGRATVASRCYSSL